MIEVKINSEFIKLGQVLKLAGLVDSGIVAKIFIQEGRVLVNGEVDLRRGRKVYPGDTVALDNDEITVTNK